MDQFPWIRRLPQRPGKGERPPRAQRGGIEPQQSRDLRPVEVQAARPVAGAPPQRHDLYALERRCIETIRLPPLRSVQVLVDRKRALAIEREAARPRRAAVRSFVRVLAI